MAIERNFTGHEMGDGAELRYGSGGGFSLSSIVDDATARSGTYYLRQTAAGGSSNLLSFPAGTIVGTSGTVSSGNHKRVTLRSYIRIESTLNNGQCRIIGFGNDTGTCTVWFGAQNTSGGFTQPGSKIGLRIGSQSHDAVAGAYPWGTVDLSLDVWYRLILEIDLDVNATTVLSASLRVTEDSDSPTVDFTLTNSLNIGATDNLDKCAYGYSSVPGAFGRQIAIHHDDTIYIATSDSDAASQPTLPDVDSIVAIVPPTGLVLNQWTGSYTDVDEYPVSGTDTMSSSTASAEVEFSHPSAIELEFRTVSAIKLYLNAAISGAGTGLVDYILNGTAKSATLTIQYPGVNGGHDPVGGILWQTLTPPQFAATTFGIKKQNGTQSTLLANIGLEVLASPASYGSGAQIRGETQIKEGSIYDAQIADTANIARHKIEGFAGGPTPIFFPDDPLPDDWVIPGPPGASAATVRIPVVPVFLDADSGSGGSDDGLTVPGPVGPTGPAGASGVSYNGEVLLAELTASSSSSLDLISRNVAGQSGAIFQSDYDVYLVKIQNLIPATNGVDMYWRYSTDGGSTFDSSSLYASTIAAYNGAGGTAFTGDTIGSPAAQFPLRKNAEVGNSASYGLSGQMTIFNPLGSTYKRHIADFGYMTNSTDQAAVRSGGVYLNATAVNALRFLMSSGNISSGVIRVYGLTKTPQSLQAAPAHGLVLLAEKTGSGVSALDFVSRNVGSLTGAIFQTDYDEYWFEVENVLPATDAVSLSMRVSTDGGSTFVSSNDYRYGFSYSSSANAGGTSGSNSTSSIPFIGTASNSSSGGGQNGWLRLYNPLSSTQQKLCNFFSAFLSNDSNYYHIHGMGAYAQTTAVNAVRFLESSGNLTGTIRCYGVIKGVTYPVSTIETGTHASRPSAGNAGRIYLPNDGFSLGRDSGTAWSTFGPVFPFTPPSDSGFSWLNQGSSTLATTKDALQLFGAATGSGYNLVGRVKTAPSTPYTITAFILGGPIMKNWLGYGIFLRQSGAGGGQNRIHILQCTTLTTSTTAPGQGCRVSKENSATSHNTDYVAFCSGPINWFRITDNGTNIISYVSVDGQNWIQVHSISRTDFLSQGPDQIGFGVTTENNVTPNIDNQATVLSWLQT